MKAIIVFYIFLFAICTAGCSKEKSMKDDKQEFQFAFKVKKNGVDWKASSSAGYYNKNDSTYRAVGIGENGEQLGFTFKRTPLSTGRLDEFYTGVTMSSCPSAPVCRQVIPSIAVNQIN